MIRSTGMESSAIHVICQDTGMMLSKHVYNAHQASSTILLSASALFASLALNSTKLPILVDVNASVILNIHFLH